MEKQENKKIIYCSSFLPKGCLFLVASFPKPRLCKILLIILFGIFNYLSILGWSFFSFGTFSLSLSTLCKELVRIPACCLNLYFASSFFKGTFSSSDIPTSKTMDFGLFKGLEASMKRLLKKRGCNYCMDSECLHKKY